MFTILHPPKAFKVSLIFYWSKLEKALKLRNYDSYNMMSHFTPPTKSIDWSEAHSVQFYLYSANHNSSHLKALYSIRWTLQSYIPTSWEYDSYDCNNNIHFVMYITVTGLNHLNTQQFEYMCNVPSLNNFLIKWNLWSKPFFFTYSHIYY